MGPRTSTGYARKLGNICIVLSEEERASFQGQSPQSKILREVSPTLDTTVRKGYNSNNRSKDLMSLELHMQQ
jgi:hypothetical protein